MALAFHTLCKEQHDLAINFIKTHQQGLYPVITCPVDGVLPQLKSLICAMATSSGSLANQKLFILNMSYLGPCSMATATDSAGPVGSETGLG